MRTRDRISVAVANFMDKLARQTAKQPNQNNPVPPVDIDNVTGSILSQRVALKLFFWDVFHKGQFSIQLEKQFVFLDASAANFDYANSDAFIFRQDENDDAREISVIRDLFDGAQAGDLRKIALLKKWLELYLPFAERQIGDICNEAGDVLKSSNENATPARHTKGGAERSVREVEHEVEVKVAIENEKEAESGVAEPNIDGESDDVAENPDDDSVGEPDENA